MQQPGHFPLAMRASFSIMIVVYLGVGLVSHHCLGTDTPAYLIDVLPHGGWVKRVSSVLMSYHVMVSYVINHQVLARKLHHYYATHVIRIPSSVDYVKGWSGRKVWRSQMQWTSISIICGIFAWLIANVVPFFSALVALVGSVCHGPLFYFWPAVLFA